MQIKLQANQIKYPLICIIYFVVYFDLIAHTMWAAVHTVSLLVFPIVANVAQLCSSIREWDKNTSVREKNMIKD